MKHNFEKYCKDYKNIENYDKALADNFKGWCCHHRLQTWTLDGDRRDVDISMEELKTLGMYYNRPASELIFLTAAEHKSLHNEGNKYFLGKHHSEESKKKNSDAHRVKYAGEKNPMYGKKHSDETKKKMSCSWDYDKHFTEETRKKIGAASKGKHWFTNGNENKFCYECPDGFVKGRLLNIK